MQVPPIVMPMQADSNFNINKYKGKFVFVEFWASWCAPCRNSNQNIVELFHQYQQEKKDVVFVMISLDDKRQNWQKALLQDSLQPMINLIDTLAWKSKVANDFGINSIPASFLINKEGYIVGKDLTKREVQLLIKKME